MRYVLWAVLALFSGGCGKPRPTLAHGKPLGAWVEALQDPKADVRKRAAKVLGNIGPVDPAVVPALTGAVGDRDARVRAEAVRALLRLGPAACESIPALREARKDPDARVRGVAAQAGERLGDGE
jgi:HEAT repeat protein